MTGSDTGFMQAALEEAERAGESGEIPVGAVVVKDEVIIAPFPPRTPLPMPK